MVALKQVVLGSALGLVSINLQGCGLSSFVSFVKGGTSDCPEVVRLPSVDGTTSQAFITAGGRGDAGAVTCDDGYEYEGPELECAWAGRLCLAKTQADVNEDTTCNKEFEWLEKGHGLKEWPKGASVTLLDPDEASIKQKLLMHTVASASGATQVAYRAQAAAEEKFNEAKAKTQKAQDDLIKAAKDASDSVSEGAQRRYKEAKAKAEAAATALKERAHALKEKSEATAKAMKESAGKHLSKAREELDAKLKAAQKSADKHLQSVKAAVAETQEKVVAAGAAVKQKAHDLHKATSDAVSNAASAAKERAEAVADAAKKKAHEVHEKVSDAASKAKEGVEHAASKAKEAVHDVHKATSDAVSTVKSKVSEAAEGVKSRASDAVEHVKTKASDAVEHVASKASDAAKKGLETAGDVKDVMKGVVTASDQLKEGVAAAPEALSKAESRRLDGEAAELPVPVTTDRIKCVKKKSDVTRLFSPLTPIYSGAAVSMALGFFFVSAVILAFTVALKRARNLRTMSIAEPDPEMNEGAE